MHAGAATNREIRKLLRRSWVPFFTRFGKLTQVQQLTIPRVLDGKGVVVASATASGKTEAVVAPLAELAARERWGPLSIVYVVPTRALANDVLRRIEGPLADMSLSARLKHGDKPYLPSEDVPHCLITTPESLDSLICRRSQQFQGVRHIILDEIHLLDGTFRGDHLRVLLRRLMSLTGSPGFRTHMLSATLGNPDETALRYTDEYYRIDTRSQRNVQFQIVSDLQEAVRFAKAHSWRKLLLFCNKRESVEAVASALAPLLRPYPVVAHHGSLARQIREEAEQVMRECRVAACVATSTLEVGIDIGDIDAVVLAEVPWSLSSLRQRIGRSNRKDATVQSIAIAAGDAESTIVRAMFEAASSGMVDSEPYSPELSVAVQQVFSCVYQDPSGISLAVLEGYLSPLCDAKTLGLVLENLESRDWIAVSPGHVSATTKLRNSGDTGKIHSNVPDSGGLIVINSATGRQVGRVSGVIDHTFVLAHRTWRVISMDSDRILAEPVAGSGSTPIFVPTRQRGAFFGLLPAELRSAAGRSD